MKATNETGRPQDWRFYDERGNEVRIYPRSIKISGRLDELAEMTFEINLDRIVVSAVPRWVVTNPETGSRKYVEEIRFADGSTWTPPAVPTCPKCEGHPLSWAKSPRADIPAAWVCSRCNYEEFDK